ncbi:MAG: hypothetical protein IKG42_04950 [Clostridia bacterium]|nr:hypothetical protein [Clostridia bacterium]
MNMFNKLPYFVILKGKKYKINVDFRNIISFEKKLQDKSVKDDEKIEYIIRHFYPAFFYAENYKNFLFNPQLYKEAIQKFIWFYKCGREEYHKGKSGGKYSQSEIFSYEYDDEYIYGAFLEQYKIDLSTEKIHWWKFKALLKSLKDDTEFVKIKGYRAYSGDDKNMKELKKYWELPLPSEEQKRLDLLYEKLK